MGKNGISFLPSYKMTPKSNRIPGMQRCQTQGCNWTCLYSSPAPLSTLKITLSIVHQGALRTPPSTAKMVIEAIEMESSV